jgi:hypothetical protein
LQDLGLQKLLRPYRDTQQPFGICIWFGLQSARAWPACRLRMGLPSLRLQTTNSGEAIRSRQTQGFVTTKIRSVFLTWAPVIFLYTYNVIPFY